MRIEIDRVNKCFGGVHALEDVSLEFPEGAVTAIIGPNGAGKTTLFNVIAGFLTPDSGSVDLIITGDDAKPGAGCKTETKVNLVGLRPHLVAELSVGVLFQDVRVFPRLSALDNVACAAKNQKGEEPWNSLLRPKMVALQEAENIKNAKRLLDRVGLIDKAHLMAEQLSYGQQKLVAIARLLAGDASVLLLDEPTSGVHPIMIDKLLELIQSLAIDDRRTVLMIEHNLNVVRRIGDWVYLMENGRVEVFGTPDEVLGSRALRRVFPTL